MLDAKKKIGLLYLANSATPYTVAFLKRLATEIPEFELTSVFTRDLGSANWEMEIPKEINPIFLTSKGEHVFRSRFRRPVKDLLRSVQIMRYIRKNNIKIAIINGYDDLAYMPLFAFAYQLGINVFLRGDSNVYKDEHISGLKRITKLAFVKKVISQCSGVMTMGQLGRQYFSQYGAKKDQTFLVPVEPDYNLFSCPSPRSLKTIKSKFNLKSNRKRLFFSGRFAPVKRLDLLINAVSEIFHKFPDWDLVIAGSGELEHSLKALVHPDIANRVQWLGFLQAEELSAVYNLCHVLVVPSAKEPWGLVVNEATAAGLPIVASHVVGAANELVEDGVSGRIFQSGNKDSLISALSEVMNEDNYLRMRAEVPKKLEEWRNKADPVEGVRKALRSVSLL